MYERSADYERQAEVMTPALQDHQAMRLLYIDTYTQSEKDGVPVSSDAIGYGKTCSPAIINGLAALGCEVRVVRPKIQRQARFISSRELRLKAIHKTYTQVSEILSHSRWNPDVIFLFHSFGAFPTEIQRIMCDVGVRVPLVGYTHGSHWDSTDQFRFDHYPGLELLDLANLAALDRILVVSNYLQTTLASNLRKFSKSAADRILRKTAVVGLPLNAELIDRHRSAACFDCPTIIFNHAPVFAKRPDIFVGVMTEILRRHRVNVLLTRRFGPGDYGKEEVDGFALRFGNRVTLGNDLSVDDYYRSLWRSHIQVSTAQHESLGVATLEAMYTRNCCILPRAGSYPEICGEITDSLYDPGGDDLVDRVTYFLNNPKHRSDVAEQLSQQASRYLPGRVIRSIYNVLLEVVDRVPEFISDSS